MVAFGPIHTSSSITTGRRSNGWRAAPRPRGEQATASAMRGAAAMGWKSASMTVACHPMTTRHPMRISRSLMSVASWK